MYGIAKLIFLVFSFLLITTAEATDSVTWENPVNLSKKDSSSVSAVVKGGFNGDSYAIWSRYDGKNYIIQSSRLNEFNLWESAEDVSLPGADAFFADIGIDRKGNAISVWTLKKGAHTIIQTSTKPLGQNWSNPITLTGDEEHSGSASSPKIVFGPKDEAYVIWQKIINKKSVVQLATLEDISGEWSPPLTISKITAQNATKPHLAVSPNGNLMAIWIDTVSNSIQVSSSKQRSSWSHPVALSVAGQMISSPQLGFDQAGNATVIWSRSNGSNFIVQTVNQLEGQSWSTPLDISNSYENSVSPVLAIDHLGNILIVWQKIDSKFTSIQGASKQNNADWSPVFNLTNGEQDASIPQCSFGPLSKAYVVWKISNGSNFVIQSTNRTSDHNWHQPTTISLPGEDAVDPKICVDGKGQTIVIWQGSDGFNSIIQGTLGTH